MGQALVLSLALMEHLLHVDVIALERDCIEVHIIGFEAKLHFTPADKRFQFWPCNSHLFICQFVFLMFHSVIWVLIWQQRQIINFDSNNLWQKNMISDLLIFQHPRLLPPGHSTSLGENKWSKTNSNQINFLNLLPINIKLKLLGTCVLSVKLVKRVSLVKLVDLRKLVRSSTTGEPCEQK